MTKEGNKIFLCLNCYHEDVVDYLEYISECPICGSQAYEEIEPEKEWGY